MKNVSAALLAHLRGHAQTMCGLFRIGPLEDESYFGFTSLDRDVTYDASDGVGEITYYHLTGYETQNLSSTSDLGVDNTTADTLTPVYPNPNGITVEQVDRGDLDAVSYEIFAVNYQDLSMGHLHWASGVLGGADHFPRRAGASGTAVVVAVDETEVRGRLLLHHLPGLVRQRVSGLRG